MIEESNAHDCYYGGSPLLVIKCPRIRSCECVAKAKWREGHWKVIKQIRSLGVIGNKYICTEITKN